MRRLLLLLGEECAADGTAAAAAWEEDKNRYLRSHGAMAAAGAAIRHSDDGDVGRTASVKAGMGMRTEARRCGMGPRGRSSSLAVTRTEVVLDGGRLIAPRI